MNLQPSVASHHHWCCTNRFKPALLQVYLCLSHRNMTNLFSLFLWNSLLMKGSFFTSDSVDHPGDTVSSDMVPQAPAFPVSPPTPYGKRLEHSWMHLRFKLHLLPLASEAFPRLPAETWQTAAGPQVDTRYVCEFVPSTHIAFGHTHAQDWLAAISRARGHGCFQLVTSGCRRADGFLLASLLIILGFVARK